MEKEWFRINWTLSPIKVQMTLFLADQLSKWSGFQRNQVKSRIVTLIKVNSTIQFTV